MASEWQVIEFKPVVSAKLGLRSHLSLKLQNGFAIFCAAFETEKQVKDKFYKVLTNEL